jgi:hypothetical protein
MKWLASAANEVAANTCLNGVAPKAQAMEASHVTDVGRSSAPLCHQL